MTFVTVPMRTAAPPQSAHVQLDPDKVVWHLTLDQVESGTGRVVGRVEMPAGQAGSSTFVFDATNVLYSKLRPYLNKVVCPNDVGISTTEMVPLRPRCGAFERRFIAYYLRSDAFVRFASQAVAGVKMPRIIMDKFWSHKIPMPALSEQRRIVEILDQADALRQQRRAADEKADRIRNALFYSHFGDPATNPKGWTVKSIGDVLADTQYGTSKKANLEGRGVPVLRMNNIDTLGRIDLTDIKYVELSPKEIENVRLEPGDILFNRTNSRELVGKTGLWDRSDEAVPASYLIRVRVDRGQALPEVLWAYMNTPFMKQLLLNKSRRAIGMANINSRELKGFPFPIVGRELQERFVARLRQQQEIDRIRASSRGRVSDLFAVLLHRAFSGQLTAGWRERNRTTLDAELQEQLRLLEVRKQERISEQRIANGEIERHAGHDMYNKAALVTYIVTKCHDPARPNSVGRTKLAKLFYLVQRRADILLTQQFARRAAGPLDDAIHKFLNLAKRNGWLTLAKAQGNLKPVVLGRDPQPAIDHVRERWGAVLPTIDLTLDAMKGWGWEALERWATVEHAAHDLLTDSKPVTVETVKSAIAACPEWKQKLNRPAFSDSEVQSTLTGLRKHGYLPTEVGAT